MKKTIVYIDGFNLYFGAVRDTKLKWLNLEKLSKLLLPKNNIIQIKYFTARITGRPNDPTSPNRQQTYLRALRTLSNFEIIYGHFLSHNVRMPEAKSKKGTVNYVEVIKTEEKGSDVNLATHLLNDAHNKRFELAVLLTNDSDLLLPIRIVQNELSLPVGILNPQKKASWVLAKNAKFVKQIRKGALAASQFPQKLKDSKGVISKPKSW